MRIKGFNHMTINVSNLGRSIQFYVEILGMQLVHKGKTDAYLEWGTAWYCLQERPDYHFIQQEQLGFDHIAFTISIEDFDPAVEWLKQNAVAIIRGPIKRGKGWSIYFTDPDGTRLELHTSNLHERMDVWK